MRCNVIASTNIALHNLLNQFGILAFLLSVGVTALAQETVIHVSGKVISSETSAPLPYCSVFISGKSIGTITNADGLFELKLAANEMGDTLVISHIGYRNYYMTVNGSSNDLQVAMEEATVNLSNVSVEAKAMTADEVFENVINKIKTNDGYPTSPFRLDGFYREVHESGGERTGVLESAIEVYDDRLTESFKDIVISHFRKTYDKQKNTDQFIATKEGHNHLLLLLNQNINLVPIANITKKTIWKSPLTIREVSYFNDRLVYVLTNKSDYHDLKLVVDLEDFSLYKNELKLYTEEKDYKHYAWSKVNTDGEQCGAILDHQSFEYRKVNGLLFPYYFSRRFDFRCYDLVNQDISTKAAFSTELLINNVAIDDNNSFSPDKMKKKQGLINRKEPYDSSFWNNFNDIKDVTIDQTLIGERSMNETSLATMRGQSNNAKVQSAKRELRIGDHEAYQFTRADTLYGRPDPLYDSYDVYHYDLSVNIEPRNETIQGTSQMSFQVLEELDSLRLDLFEYMELEAVSHNDVPLQYSRDYDAVYLKFPELLAAGGLHTVELTFSGHPLDINFENWAGGFLWQEDDEGLPFAQSLCQGYGPKGWWPVKNDLDDEPDSVDLHITVPDHLIAVANGRLQKVDSLDDSKRRYHYRASNPVNNYGIATHIGNYISKSDQYIDEEGLPLEIQYFFLPQDSVLAREKLAMVPGMLEVYEKYFGSYPFREDGFKMVQSPYPMEHQSCVAVGQYFDTELILHETAHEWWGNSVSCTDNADIWIHEAFATYAESLYIEETLGYELGQAYLNARKADIHNDHPLVGVSGVNHFHYRIEDKYSKGALMLNTLRHLVNDDERWFDMIRDIQRHYRHKSINTDLLVEFMLDQIGSHYSSFFKHYLYSTSIPILRVRKMSSGPPSIKLDNVNEELTLRLVLSNQDELIANGTWSETSIDLRSQEIAEELESRYLIKLIIE